METNNHNIDSSCRFVLSIYAQMCCQEYLSDEHYCLTVVIKKIMTPFAQQTKYKCKTGCRFFFIENLYLIVLLYCSMGNHGRQFSSENSNLLGKAHGFHFIPHVIT